jgi:hypothetical protein
MVFRQIIMISFVACCVMTAFVSMTSKKAKECCNRNLLNPGDSVVIRQRQLLRNVAFCSCISAAYPADSVLRNDGSLSGYFQTGSYGTNTFLAINEAAMKYIKAAKNKYNSIDGQPLGMMKCLDWYNSKELDSLVRNFDNDIIFYPPLDSIEKKN